MYSFDGEWLLKHWYPSPDDSCELSSEYIMNAYKFNKTMMFVNRPCDRRTVYLVAQLNILGKMAKGSWFEISRPEGLYSGATYEGSGFMVIVEEGHLEGLWAGAGTDRVAGEPRIYTGRWELTRILKQ